VLRAGDCAARLGGDEFVLLIRDAERTAHWSSPSACSAPSTPPSTSATWSSASAPASGWRCAAMSPTGERAGRGRPRDVPRQATREGRGRAVRAAHAAGRTGPVVPGERPAACRPQRSAPGRVPAIVDLTNGAIAGVEALVRWQDPVRGFVSPAEFIPIAEETGLILPLGEWVLREAVAQLAGGTVRPADVARAQRQRVEPAARAPRTALGASTAPRRGADPSQLVMEITETALGVDDEATMHTLRALREPWRAPGGGRLRDRLLLARPPACRARRAA
jgi:hypothetical protein